MSGILLTGDVEPDGQARLLRCGADLRADVLKMPHHGSARQEPAFFAATGARVAIASAGRTTTTATRRPARSSSPSRSGWLSCGPINRAPSPWSSAMGT